MVASQYRMNPVFAIASSLIVALAAWGVYQFGFSYVRGENVLVPSGHRGNSYVASHGEHLIWAIGSVIMLVIGLVSLASALVQRIHVDDYGVRAYSLTGNRFAAAWSDIESFERHEGKNGVRYMLRTAKASLPIDWTTFGAERLAEEIRRYAPQLDRVDLSAQNARIDRNRLAD